MLPWDSIMPIMITRMIVSLKKAGGAPDSGWRLTSDSQAGGENIARRTIGGTERGGSDTLLGRL